MLHPEEHELSPVVPTLALPLDERVRPRVELLDLRLRPFVLDILPSLVVLQGLPRLPVLVRDVVHDPCLPGYP